MVQEASSKLTFSVTSTGIGNTHNDRKRKHRSASNACKFGTHGTIQMVSISSILAIENILPRPQTKRRNEGRNYGRTNKTRGHDRRIHSEPMSINTQRYANRSNYQPSEQGVSPPQSFNKRRRVESIRTIQENSSRHPQCTKIDQGT